MAVAPATFRNYSKMLVSTNQATNTVFLSALFPFSGTAPEIQPVNIANELVLKINTGAFRDLIFNSLGGTTVQVPADSSGFGTSIAGNGKINFYSTSAGNLFSAAFIQSGDSLIAGNQLILHSGTTMDIAFERLDSCLYEGYVSGSGSMKFFCEKPLQTLQGNISAIDYDSTGHLVLATFSSKGNFKLGTTDLTWLWTGTTDSTWNNAKNWQLMNHPDVNGIPQASNNVVIPGNATRMPVIGNGQVANCNNLTIKSAASLTILNESTLFVKGNLTLE
jgi:hypothetical protein